MGKGSPIAELEYPVRIRGGFRSERLVIYSSPRRLLDVKNEDDCRAIHIGMNLLLRDIETAYIGEYAACRLLTPFNAHLGAELIEGLAERYIVRSLKDVVIDTLKDYEMGALTMKFKASYFLLKKLKAKLSLYPPFQRIFWWLGGQGDERNLLEIVVRRVERGLEKLCEEGVLVNEGAHYRFDTMRAMEILNERTSRYAKSVRVDRGIANVLKTGNIGIFNPRLLLSDILEIELENQIKTEPEDYAFVTTSIGEQSLRSNYKLSDIASRYMAASDVATRISRRGSLLNSTYVVEVIDESKVTKLFVKRYFTWTDVKWIVAKLWAMPLRNFYISPSTRLGNELFFLSFLKEKGFSVPEIIHIDWSEKVLVEQFIDGQNLVEVWTREGVEGREEITRLCGELLARIHGARVVIGDCKPDNFIVKPNDSRKAWIVDLEQASTKGDLSWDIAECILYIGHYLTADDSENYASSFVEGYLSKGSVENVEKALDPRYQFIMMPWTPIWVQVRLLDAVRRVLRS